MKKLLFLIPVLLTSFAVLGQSTSKWSIKGSIQDAEGKPLNSATITIENPKDSTLVTFGISKPNGDFEIKNLREETVNVKIDFVGFENLIQQVSKPNDLVEDLGVISLKEKINELSEFVVQEVAPVTIKKDTIEYNAGSFKTLPNANAEDLLKRLPGLEIDADGNIKAQGETVRRVLVDGKEFFGNDPKLATKNLMAESIEKVQVLDRKSEQAQFTGIDDGQREKTINLKLKSDFKKGFFGNITAGLGNNNRDMVKGNLNKFTDKQQLSFLLMNNNINDQGFSFEDYINFSGGVQNMMSNNGGRVQVTIGGPGSSNIPLNNGQRVNGIMRTNGFGTNFNSDFNKKTQLRSSYFYNGLNHNIIQDTERINFFPRGNINFNENSLVQNTNGNHRLNLILDHKIDTLNSFRSTTSAQFTQTDRVTSSNSMSKNENGELINQGERQNSSVGDVFNINSEFLYRHRFNKAGRTFSANFRGSAQKNEEEGLLNAVNEFFGSQPSKDIIRQENTQRNENFNYGVNISYTEPLGKRKYLELVYNYSQNLNQVDRQVFDWNESGLVFNKSLSNQFTSNYIYQRPGANFSYNGGKYNLVSGVAMQNTSLKGDLILLDQLISNKFQNFLPNMRLTYNFSNTKNLMFNYQTSVNEPSIQQLQPVINNNDPLNIFVGNPELRPAYLHSWRVNYNSFDMGKSTNVFTSASLNLTENAIVNAQSIDERLVRVIQPVNVKNNITGNWMFNVGFPINAIHSRINLGPNLSFNKGLNLLNNVEETIQTQNLGGNVRYDFNYKEVFNLGLSTNLSRQSTSYAFNTLQNQLFFNKTFTADIGVNFLKNYTFAGNFSYLSYTSKTTDFNQSLPLLNLSLSRFVLKNNKGEIKLSGQNLLNQNVGVSQRAEINFVEQTVTNNLGRFVMFSFLYKLNSNLNPMNNMQRRGAGSSQMIRIIN
jgi:hypothetical protein